MKTTSFVSLLVSFVLTTALFAQEPPGWVNMGNLPEAKKIRDVLEIPGTNTILACGDAIGYDNYARIWKSDNGGISWKTVAQVSSWPSHPPDFIDLHRDSNSGRIWAVREQSGNNTLYYSTDNGETWTAVSGEPYGSKGNKIVAIGNYLYYGGTLENPYSIALYRIHQTTLEWEIVKSYPECNAITELTYHNGKLVVFCRDKSGSLVRVFTHTPASLDKTATLIGKATVSEVTDER